MEALELDLTKRGSDSGRCSVLPPVVAADPFVQDNNSLRLSFGLFRSFFVCAFWSVARTIVPSGFFSVVFCSMRRRLRSSRKLLLWPKAWFFCAGPMAALCQAMVKGICFHAIVAFCNVCRVAIVFWTGFQINSQDSCSLLHISLSATTVNMLDFVAQQVAPSEFMCKLVIVRSCEGLQFMFVSLNSICRPTFW